ASLILISPPVGWVFIPRSARLVKRTALLANVPRMAETMFIRASKRRAPLRFAICALCTTILLVANWKWDALKDAERYAHDQFARRGRKTPQDPRLVLIGIDRASYEDAILESEGATNATLGALRGSYPWSRKVWADAVERLANA